MREEIKKPSKCSLEEKKEYRIKCFENMLCLLNSRVSSERSIIVWIRSIIYKLNILKGDELKKCIDALEPIYAEE